MKRLWLCFAVSCFLCFGYVEYTSATDNWFAENVQLRIGLLFSPWFEYRWFVNPIEGGDFVRANVWSWSVVALAMGFVCVRQYRRTANGSQPQ